MTSFLQSSEWCHCNRQTAINGPKLYCNQWTNLRCGWWFRGLGPGCSGTFRTNGTILLKLCCLLARRVCASVCVSVMSLFSGSWQAWQQGKHPMNIVIKAQNGSWTCSSSLLRYVFFSLLLLHWIMHDFIWSSAFLTFLLTSCPQPFHLALFILSSKGMNDGCSCCSADRIYTQHISGGRRRKTRQQNIERKHL